MVWFLGGQRWHGWNRCTTDREGSVMNRIDQRIQDRETLLAMLVSDDRWATAALKRSDDLALLRRIAKAPLDDARALAVERAWMRGTPRNQIAKALGITDDELCPYVAAIYAPFNPSTRA